MLEFVDVTIDDYDFIARLRNDKDNKQYFMSKSDITYDGHKNFIEDLDASSDKYWIVQWKKEPIGTIGLYNIDMENGICEFGRFIVAKEHRGMGFGLDVVYEAFIRAESMGIRHLYLRVLRNNEIAIKLYTKVGFKPSQEINNILCMWRHFK